MNLIYNFEQQIRSAIAVSYYWPYCRELSLIVLRIEKHHDKQIVCAHGVKPEWLKCNDVVLYNFSSECDYENVEGFDGWIRRTHPEICRAYADSNGRIDVGKLSDANGNDNVIEEYLDWAEAEYAAAVDKIAGRVIRRAKKVCKYLGV